MKTFKFLGIAAIVASTLTFGSVPPAGAVWPGVNGSIVFQSHRDGNNEIYIMASNGSGQTRLTNDSADDSGPKWNPTGPVIVFSSLRSGNGDIYTMDSTGANLQQITNSTDPESQPGYSPDGTHIVYMRSTGTGSHLWVMTSSGTKQHQITNSAGNDGEPVWSADGKHIAFYHYGSKRGIYTVTPKGGSRTRVTKGHDFDPDWSPNSKRIAYAHESASDNTIRTIKPNGAGMQQVTPSGQFFYDPGYSPDGTSIVTAGGSGTYHIFTLPVGGGSQTQLTFLGSNLEPDWARV